METKMETLGLFKGIYRDNGKENGSYCLGFKGLWGLRV